jgi:AcrR family transcriptional regulator
MSTMASIDGPPRSPDRRIRKTRRALGDALLELCVEKPYVAITVQDVIDRADVSRSTFYAHYVDKDGLLIDAFRDLRLRSAVEEQPSDEPREVFGWSLGVFRWSFGLLCQFSAAEGLYRSMVGSPGCDLAVQELERELDGLARDDLARLAGLRPERVPAVVVGFVTRAFMCILAWWLDRPDGRSPEEVDQLFRVLTLPGAATALGVPLPGLEGLALQPVEQ